MIKMIDDYLVRKYLEIVSNIKKSHRLFDCHAHPFDIFSSKINYSQNSGDHNLYSADNSVFAPIKISSVRLQEIPEAQKIINPVLKETFLKMKIKSLYSHTGSRVFYDHMEISGIDKVLLLPIADSLQSIHYQMKSISEMFEKGPAFVIGTSIPEDLSNEQISDFVKEMIHVFDIKAIKIHLTIANIDLSSSGGKERLETILTSCETFGLPLIIHGGYNEIMTNPETAGYGLITHLKNVDWRISKSTVVIAHSASYGCDCDDIENNILPLLIKMLHEHDNLMVDVSGLEFAQLTLILRNIDKSRIVFGSDALYFPQWSAVVKLLHSLFAIKENIEDAFVQIASINPSKTVFSRT